MKILLLFLLAFSGLSTIIAQGNLTFEAAVQKTLANNFDIRIEKNVATQVANMNNPGNAGYLPKVAVNADQYFSSSNTRQEFFSGQINQRDNAKNQSLTANIRLDWTIFDGFTMFAKDQRLQLESDQAAMQVRAQMEMSIYQTAVLYYSLVYQKQMNEVYKAALNLSRERYALLQLKQKYGSASDLQLLQAQLDFNTDSSNVIRHAKTVRDLKTELVAVMGEASQIDFDVSDVVPSIPAVNREGLRTAAIAQNTSLLLQKSTIAIIDAQRKEMQGKYYPQLSLYGQYAVATSQSQVGILQSNRSLGPGVGITLRWTILDQLSNFTQLKNNELQHENAQLMISKQEQLIDKELNLAFSNYDYALMLNQLENASMINVENIFSIAQKTYESGSMTALELREIQFSIIESRNRQLAASLALKTAELNLFLLSGDFKSMIN